MKTNNDAREAALARGDKHFEGTPCRVCSATLRYSRNSTCVACANRHRKSTRDDLKKVVATFEGNPCKKCGSTLRYASTRKCIACHRQECQESRADGVESPSYASAKRKAEKEMKRRLAMIRAERTAKQKACAYGVRV